MKEIEAKFLVSSVDEIKSRLENSGFSKEKDFTELVTCYDTPDGRWKDRKTTIRTKVIDEKLIFTVKKRIEGEFKSSMEKECSVNAPINEFREMLQMIDLTPSLEYSKTRKHYTRTDGSAAELDHIEETGDRFIELETQSEDEMRNLIVELGFENIIPDLRSYPNIIREYRESQ